MKGESLIGSQVKLKWLRENMLPLGEEPTEQQLHAQCRTYTRFDWRSFNV